jgi:hypothetical protein
VTAEVPAYVDLPTTRAAGRAGVRTWLRGIGVRQVLITGLVMFATSFALLQPRARRHFLRRDGGVAEVPALWRLPVVNDTLYIAAVIHFSLGL